MPYIVLLWHKTFIKAASGRVIDSIGEFNAQNLANAVWAFAKLSKTAERRAAQQAPPSCFYWFLWVKTH